MDKHLGAAAAGMLAVALAGPVWACDDKTDSRAAAGSPLVQALDRVRAEQREAMARSARTALAQLRSETATALAQGAAPAAGAAVRTGP